MKIDFIILFAISSFIFNKGLFASDDTFTTCGTYSISGHIDCKEPAKCFFSIWKGSLSEKSYPMTSDEVEAKKFNHRSVKTNAIVIKINPLNLIIEGNFTPIIPNDMREDIRLIEKEICQE